MLMPSIFGENLFDDFFGGFPFYDDRDFRRAEKKLYGKNAGHLMKTDIREQEDGYLLDIELPGFKKEEIKMELEDGYLTIAAARTASNEERSEQGKLVRQERFSGSCTRTYFIGEEMNVEDIKARYENGELKVFVPKKDPQALQTKKTISIE